MISVLPWMFYLAVVCLLWDNIARKNGESGKSGGKCLMRMEQLKYFVEVARCQSIKGASEKLYLTQQSLSQTLKNLEKELGFLLLNRTTTGVTLTEEGKLFFAFAEKVLAEQVAFWQQIDFLQHQADEKLHGTLNLYIFGLYDICILPEILNQFCLQYPNVAIQTAKMSLKDIETSFFSEEAALITWPSFDVARYAEQLQQQALRLIPFAEGRYVLCCNQEHPLAKGSYSAVCLQEAMQYPVVQYNFDRFENDTLHRILAHYGYGEKEYALLAQSVHTWAANLLRGDTIGFLNEFIFVSMKEKYDSFQDLVVLPVREELQGTMACIVRQDCPPLVEKFLRFLPKQK